MKRQSQHGVALVITLIMLAVVTVMAVLFLGISRRERASVTVNASLTDARLAADSGQTRALSEVVARITAQTNLFAYDFRVSTNFINRTGFRTGLASPTNVSYTYANGQPLNNDNDIRQNQLNLYYDPRPPVYVVTNATTGASEFRFYHDLNRNGRFDTNGVQAVVDSKGIVIQRSNSFYWGDPEWIGILEHPDLHHGPTNRFIGRYAYVVVPAGRTLDINYNHNNAKLSDLSRSAFFRNEGVGAWEINLAAFLRELNTNIWTAPSYAYVPLQNPPLGPSGGYAFGDALSILSYRYQNNKRSLKSINQAYGGTIGNAFRTDQIDIYSDGPLMVGLKPPTETGTADDPAQPWSGSYNTNGYSSVQDLFDTNKTSQVFVARLTNALARLDTYNRNTFYRLMSQLGTDSLPANRLSGVQLTQLGLPPTAIVGKLNLNYDNVDRNTGAIDPNLTSSVVPWTPLRFFTNAADLMLRSQSSAILRSMGVTATNVTLSLTNIPIYPTNLYVASVHRLMQLAANLSQTTVTNRFLLTMGTNAIYAPFVFRPLLGARDGVIYIRGYEEVTNNAASVLARQWVDLDVPINAASGLISAVQANPFVNVYGLPWVIGAEKGIPNFNEFLLRTTAQVTRRLEARRDRPQERVRYRQSYQVGITNTLATEAWNPYSQTFARQLTLLFTNRTSMVLTNGDKRLPVPDPTKALTIATNMTIGTWAQWNPGDSAGPSFQVPMNTNVITFPEAAILSDGRIGPAGTNRLSFEGAYDFYPTPDLKLYITNRLQYVLIDTVSGRMLDYVSLDRMLGSLDFTQSLIGKTNEFSDTGLNHASFWRTNRSGIGLGVPTWGITNQINVSTNDSLARSDWSSYSDDPTAGLDKPKAVDNFRKLLGLPPIFDKANTNIPYGTVQVPFSPTRKLDQKLSWQVNDPLVHYAAEDLYDPFYADTNNVQAIKPSQNPEPSNIGQLNERYRPWGGKPGKDPSGERLAYDVAVKDPLITKSDDWDFPTNKFPSLGWLGRVHRGTPWQTVYLKSEVEPIATWAKWAGRADTHPTNDWHLLSLFTTALNDNAASGLLSVNQTNTAAWSAVLAGVSVLTNTQANLRLGSLPTNYSSLFIEPATWQLQAIVTNINATRLRQPAQAFPDMGSVLASPALTVASPYLNVAADDQKKYGIRDEVYERIPQQILSLLKDDEPYVVIYAFGQALRPAENSIVRTPGPFRGLCTNYQVTGEVVTKTAVRIVKDPRPQSRIYKSVVESYNILPAD